MDAKLCLEKLKLVGVLSFATVDRKGNPQVRCISAIHFDEDSLYFFTARGKDFCEELLENGKVQILAYTRFKEMIRLSAKAIPAPDTEQEEKINPIFRESYTLGAGTLSEKGYVISDRCIGCGKCKKNCPQRCIAEGKPYHIQQEHCLHCGSCYEGCPVKAIEKCRNK